MSENQPVNEPPAVGNDVDTMLGMLERQRRTFAWKTGGLDAGGLQATIGASSITLGGLIKHMAMVEEDVFQSRMLGRARAAPFDQPDAEVVDWVWSSAADDTPEQLMAWWMAGVERSRAAMAEILADGGLDRPGGLTFGSVTPTVRRYLADFIEEYARHVGHADLLRESVDGLVGEDPPD